MKVMSWHFTYLYWIAKDSCRLTFGGRQFYTLKRTQVDKRIKVTTLNIFTALTIIPLHLENQNTHYNLQ